MSSKSQKVAVEESVPAPQTLAEQGNVENLYFGVELNNVPDLVDALEDHRNDFDFIVVPLAHPRNERDFSTGETFEIISL